MSEHVIKMFGCGTRLQTLWFPIPAELSTDLVLASLPPSYNSFIMNYNMNGMEKMPNELLAMLKTAEAGVRRENNQVMMVSQSTPFKKKKNRKGKGAKTQDKPKNAGQGKSQCFFYKKTGHWKRNCRKFLEKKKKLTKGDKGIIVIPQ